MIRKGEILQEMDEFLRTAESLARAQEAEIRRMQQANLDVRHAEGLLSAYREALRIARERHLAFNHQLDTQQLAAVSVVEN
jgi:predicted TIM-barrel fold metal-dependent hydrolase